MDSYLRTIKYIYSKANIINEDDDLNSFFTNGKSFPELVSLIFDEKIPGIKTKTHSIYQVKTNNQLALDFLRKKNPFFESLSIDFYDPKNQLLLINLICNKLYFKINQNSLIKRCNDFIQTSTEKIKNFSEFIRGDAFFKLMNEISQSNELFDFSSVNNEIKSQQIINYLQRLNIYTIIDESSFIQTNQDILLYQALIILESPKNSAKPINGNIASTKIEQNSTIKSDIQSEVKPNASQQNLSIEKAESTPASNKPQIAKIVQDQPIPNSNAKSESIQNKTIQESPPQSTTSIKPDAVEKTKIQSPKESTFIEKPQPIVQGRMSTMSSSNNNLHENENESNISLKDNSLPSSSFFIQKSSYLNLVNYLIELINLPVSHIIDLTQLNDGIILPAIVQYFEKSPINNIMQNPVSSNERLVNNMATLFFLQSKDQTLNPHEFNFTNENDMIHLITTIIQIYVLTDEFIEKMMKKCNEILSADDIEITNFDSNWEDGQSFIGLLNCLSNDKFIFKYNDNLTIEELKDMFVKTNCPAIIEDDSILSNLDEFIIQYQVKIILDEIEKRGVTPSVKQPLQSESKNAKEPKNQEKADETQSGNSSKTKTVENDLNHKLSDKTLSIIQVPNTNSSEPKGSGDACNANSVNALHSNFSKYVYERDLPPILRILNAIACEIDLHYNDLHDVVNEKTIHRLVAHLVGVQSIPGIAKIPFARVNSAAVLKFLGDKNIVFKYSTLDFSNSDCQNDTILRFAKTLLDQFFLKYKTREMMDKIGCYYGEEVKYSNYKSIFKYGNAFYRILGNTNHKEAQEYDEKSLLETFASSNVPYVLDEECLTKMNDNYLSYQLQLIFNIIPQPITSDNQENLSDDLDVFDTEISEDKSDLTKEDKTLTNVQDSQTIHSKDDEDPDSHYNYLLYSYKPTIVEDQKFKAKLIHEVDDYHMLNLDSSTSNCPHETPLKISGQNETTLIFSFSDNMWQYHQYNWPEFVRKNKISLYNKIKFILLSPSCISVDKSDGPYKFLSNLSRTSILSKHDADAFVEACYCGKACDIRMENQDEYDHTSLIAFQICYKPSMKLNMAIDNMETFLEFFADFVIALYPHNTISDFSHFRNTSLYHSTMAIDKEVCPTLLLISSPLTDRSPKSVDQTHSIHYQKEISSVLLNCDVFRQALDSFLFVKPTLQWIDIDDCFTYKNFIDIIFEENNKESKQYMENAIAKVTSFFAIFKANSEQFNSIKNEKNMMNFLYKMQKLDIERNYHNYLLDKEFNAKRHFQGLSRNIGKFKAFFSNRKIFQASTFTDSDDSVSEEEECIEQDIDESFANAFNQLCDAVLQRKIDKIDEQLEQFKAESQSKLSERSRRLKVDKEIPQINETKIREAMNQNHSTIKLLTYNGDTRQIQYYDHEWSSFMSDSKLSDKSKIKIIMVNNIDNELSKEVCDIISGSSLDISSISNNTFYATPIYCGTIEEIVKKFDLPCKGSDDHVILLYVHIPKTYTTNDRLFFENFLAVQSNIILNKIDMTDEFLDQSKYMKRLMKILKNESIQICHLPFINHTLDNILRSSESPALLCKDIAFCLPNSALSAIIEKEMHNSETAVLLNCQNIPMYYGLMTRIVEILLKSEKSQTMNQLTKYLEKPANNFKYSDLILLKALDIDTFTKKEEIEEVNEKTAKSKGMFLENSFVEKDYAETIKEFYKFIMGDDEKEKYFTMKRLSSVFDNPSKFISNNGTLKAFYSKIQLGVKNRYISKAAKRIENPIKEDSYSDLLTSINQLLSNSKTLINEDYVEDIKIAFEDKLRNIIFEEIKKSKLIDKNMFLLVYKKKLEMMTPEIDALKAKIDETYNSTKRVVKKAKNLTKEQIQQNSMKYTLAVREVVNEVTVQIVNDEDLEKKIPTDF